MLLLRSESWFVCVYRVLARFLLLFFSCFGFFSLIILVLISHLPTHPSSLLYHVLDGSSICWIAHLHWRLARKKALLLSVVITN